ncbi:uncharacterized protein LY89DRAFT_780639 [Mollisia scopiformis]|uniref:Fungal N-terminal domain-containing protein n=1 Tax=Mollisia scopiformis TaxID=149040 RepID=A0A194XFP2_MOLSC|nr:uncharacterized protein LY89DRAFT_780639 [Mollisia scopiformis]KUJ18592.1 hypothetical protein LY89DRAFT_780639 [Mollisia scopiformis]
MMDPITAIGAVASIWQIAQAALSLSKTLYTLGAAVGSASDDIQILADDLKTFSQSLSLLSRLLEDSKSWYSDDIYLLTAKIIKDCAELYVKIDRILVKLGSNGKSAWKLRVKFVYKESQIQKLLSRLRDMKGTLATILMSLQVDLQLSLLNISSTSKLQRPPEKPLQPDTLRILQEAQKSIMAGGILTKYTVQSESIVQVSSSEVYISSTHSEGSQSEVVSVNPNEASSSPISTMLRHQDHSSNMFHAKRKFMVLPQNVNALSPILTRGAKSSDNRGAGDGACTKVESHSPAEASPRLSNHETRTSRSLKSSSSSESFKSAISIQEQDLEIARKVKAVQSVLHAFRTALEILGNLIERRIPKFDSSLLDAARVLEASLNKGNTDIDHHHTRHFKKHNREYIEMFDTDYSSKIQNASSDLLKDVVMKLHEYSADHEDLHESQFNQLSWVSNYTAGRVIGYLDRLAKQAAKNSKLSDFETKHTTNRENFSLPSRSIPPSEKGEGRGAWFGAFQATSPADRLQPQKTPQADHVPLPSASQLLEHREMSLPFVGYTFKRFENSADRGNLSLNCEVEELPSPVSQVRSKIRKDRRRKRAYPDLMEMPTSLMSMSNDSDIDVSHNASVQSKDPTYDATPSQRKKAKVTEILHDSVPDAQSPGEKAVSQPFSGSAPENTQMNELGETPQMPMQGSHVRPSQQMGPGAPSNSQTPTAQSITKSPQPGIAVNMNAQEQLILQQKIATLRSRLESPARNPPSQRFRDRRALKVAEAALQQSITKTQSEERSPPADENLLAGTQQQNTSNIVAAQTSSPDCEVLNVFDYLVSSTSTQPDHSTPGKYRSPPQPKERTRHHHVLSSPSESLDTSTGQTPFPGTETERSPAMKPDELQDYQKQLLATEPHYKHDHMAQSQNQPIELSPAQIENQVEAARKYRLSLMPGHDPDSEESKEAHRKALKDYQMSLMVLDCGKHNTRRLQMRRISDEDEPPKDTNFSSPANGIVCLQPGPSDVLQDFDFDAFLKQDDFHFDTAADPRYFTGSSKSPPDASDVLHDFDFDSFLNQDDDGSFNFDSAPVAERSREGDKTPKQDQVEDVKKDKNSAALKLDEKLDHASGSEVASWDNSRNAMSSSTTGEDDVLYINAKQFHRILKRRTARQRFADQAGKLKSRHDPHSTAVTFDDTEAMSPTMAKDSKIDSPGISPPSPIVDPDETQDQIELAWTCPALSPTQTSKLWWQAYISLVSSSCNESAVFMQIKDCLESELGILASRHVPDDIICRRIGNNVRRLGTALHVDKPQLVDLLEVRSNILRILTTVGEQLGFEIATLGWSCVCVLLSLYEKILTTSSSSSQVDATILLGSLTHLQDIVAIIARYAVMENLYQQSNGGLSLKPEYHSALLSLCTTVLEYFAHASGCAEAELECIQNEGGSDEVTMISVKDRKRVHLQKCEFLVERIKQKDIACQGFRVVVDTKEESSYESGSETVDDVSDEDWERVESEDAGVAVMENM